MNAPACGNAFQECSEQTEQRRIDLDDDVFGSFGSEPSYGRDDQVTDRVISSPEKGSFRESTISDLANRHTIVDFCDISSIGNIN